MSMLYYFIRLVNWQISGENPISSKKLNSSSVVCRSLRMHYRIKYVTLNTMDDYSHTYM